MVAFASAGLSVAVVSPAYAQSTAVGSVYGTVPAGAGDQVLIENVGTGARRTVDVSGERFQATSVQPGNYRVSLLKGGTTVSSVTVEVLAGNGSEAKFTAAAASLGSVVVTGRGSPIDVTATTNSTTFTADQLEALPFASQNFNAIIRLAPNTTSADPRYAGGVSIGGGAPSENAFFIDGFPVTNPLTQLGSMELPFGAIASAQVQTGGFGAEFGRSVGGVFNVTTKSGTNEWHGGVDAYWEPNSLRAKPKSIYYPNTGDPLNTSTDGTTYLYKHGNDRTETQYGAYLGGPIIENRLFFFVAADHTSTNNKFVNQVPTATVALGQSGFADSDDSNDRYFAKLDFNITDNHRLSLTALGDNYKNTTDYYGYNYGTRSRAPVKTFTEYAKNLDNVTPQVGGDAQILKYVGNLTDNLTLSALAGQSQFQHSQGYSFSPTSPQISLIAANRQPGLNYVSPNPLPVNTTSIADNAKDKTESFRLDLEYKLGDHLLRAGVDDNKLKSINAGESLAGGSLFVFSRTTNGGLTPSNANAGNRITLLQGGAVGYAGVAGCAPTCYFYARQRIFTDYTDAKSDQTAQYLEDKWQVTRDVQVTAGVRNESFKNKNGDNETFLKSDNFVSPRLAAAWDTFGDSSMKVFGSAGRYSLQIPTHIAVRGASRSLLTDQYYTYSGINQATGAPTGLVSLGDVYSVNNEYNQAKDSKTVSARNMDPTYQDEVTLGLEKTLTTNVTVGTTLTARKLKSTIDDFCDARPFDAYAERNNIDTSNYGGFGCATFNPGKSNTFLVDYSGNAATTGQYTKVKLSKDELGVPTPKRTYLAANFFVEHAFADKWYGRLTYTWSQSRGNTEGQTKSDNAQTDVAATSTWDTPELMINSYGNLPSDRKHAFKAYGYFQALTEVGFGATVVAESGRPKNCIGFLPEEILGDSPDYSTPGTGGQYFYCNGEAAPRGSAGRLPWNYGLDLNAVYKPTLVRGLALRLDVFNVFNRQSATVVDDYRDINGAPTYNIRPTYERVIAYSAPRAVRLSAQYEF
ncbi:TonB-dependent receptor [soil metagenome]